MRERPWHGAAFACALGASFAAAIAVPVRAADINLDDYVQTFAEEFDSLDVSAWGPGTRWIAHTPWNGDFGSAQFIDPHPKAPFAIKDGMLEITMRRGSDGKWRSGLLASADREGKGFSQAGGYFEVRAKFPAGRGVWPAFWLCSLDNSAGGRPEVDIVEHYGQDPSKYYVNIHLWKDKKHAFNQYSAVSVKSGSLSEDFHTYGVNIDKDNLTFYFDRKEVWRTPSRPEYMKPLFILVNLAAGGGWPIDGMPDPSVMYVDYIRAYQPK